MKRKVKPLKILLCVLLALYGGALIAFPARYVKACFEGICTWAECVLPSLFPFMVICSLLIALGAAGALARPLKGVSNRLKLPACALPLFLMSACSGYPAGSRILCEYREGGYISGRECKLLAPLLSTCGPLFALGTVGVKAFASYAAGVKLLCASLLSVVCSSLIYSAVSKRPQSCYLQPRGKGRKDLLYSSFSGGVTACLVAGGFISFFYTLSQIFDDFKIFMPLTLLLSPLFGSGNAAALCRGLVEATGGCFALAANGGFFALPLAGFVVTFGGASVLLQQLAYLKVCGVSAKFFVCFKFVQGVICFALLCVLNFV